MAAIHSFLLAALLAVSVSACVGQQASGANGYDYFLFVRQWGVTFCEEGRCAVKPVERFSIHGLWPERYDRSWPSCCDSRYPFRVRKIVDLLPELTREWFSYTWGIRDQCVWDEPSPARKLLAIPEAGSSVALDVSAAEASAANEDSPNVQFWRHEWEKHGTCALDALRDEEHYFKAVLRLQRKYNLDDALSAAGIVPSHKPYRTNAVLDAIRSAFGRVPSFNCRDGNIMEVRICVDKDLELFDCPGSSHTWGCGETVTIPHAPTS